MGTFYRLIRTVISFNKPLYQAFQFRVVVISWQWGGVAIACERKSTWTEPVSKVFPNNCSFSRITQGVCEDEWQFAVVCNTHTIAMLIAKTLLAIGGVMPCCLPVCILGEKGPAHLNKDWTLSLPIQTKGEEERSAAARTEASIRTPWRRARTHRHTDSHTHLQPPENRRAG